MFKISCEKGCQTPVLTKITQLSLNMHSRLAMHILINSIWEGWLEKEKSIDIIYYQDYNPVFDS